MLLPHWSRPHRQSIPTRILSYTSNIYSLAAKQWKLVEQRSRAIGVGVHVIGALFGFLAYREKPSSSAFKYYVISAVSLLSTVPYTFAVMIPTQKKLQEKSESLASSSAGDAAAEAGVEKAETTHALLDQWATLNLGRVVLMTVGAVSALWANVDAVEYVGTQGIKLASGANRMG